MRDGRGGWAWLGRDVRDGVRSLVLLLACTNLASFLLARALDRRKEVAVRLALGASRGSLVRRLLFETTLLSLLAGGAAVGLAVWLLGVLATADLPLPTPVTLDLRLDGNVLGFTFAVSVVAGALLGLVPALQSTRPVVIVSDAMARRFWTDGDAVGRLVRRHDPDFPLARRRRGERRERRQLGEPPRDMVCLPYSQRFTPSLTVVARTSVDPERTVLALLTAGRELDPVVETNTMDRHLALMRLPQQLSSFVLSALGVLALALAAVGLFGVVSYGVARRTREIARPSCFLPAVRGAWVRRRSASTAVAAARFRGRLAAAPSAARRREHPPARDPV